MSDYRYDTYQHYGTNAERLAFTPSPPGLAGSQPVYIWFETDTLTTWLYFTSWVLIAGSGSGTLLSTTLTLTDADIKALPTTPVSLLAAPAAGFRNKLLAATVLIDAAAGAYTNINATLAKFIIRHTGAINPLLTLVADDSALSLVDFTALFGTANKRFADLTTFLQSIDSGAFAGVVGYTSSLVRPDTEADAVAIEVAVDNNGSGNFTGGNAANSGKVTAYYSVEAL